MMLKNRVAVVTGGARGIGKAIARRFVDEGASVCIGDVLKEDGERTAAELGKSCRFQYCDIGTPAGAELLVQTAINAFGRVDICVNNAAINLKGNLLDLSVEDFDEVLRVNIRGAFLVSKAAVGRMVSQGNGGAIVNLSSVNAVVARPQQTAYTVSKGAIHQLTRSLAVQLADYGIRVNAVGPGSVATDMTQGTIDEASLSRTPLRRAARTEEIAAVACFLASDEASYVTGQTIYADGGRLALNVIMPPKA
jgi:NAD(P)-dependent dehydrogenase (short-subunit alcohol dehydrogenase family)